MVRQTAGLWIVLSWTASQLYMMQVRAVPDVHAQTLVPLYLNKSLLLRHRPAPLKARWCQINIPGHRIQIAVHLASARWVISFQELHLSSRSQTNKLDFLIRQCICVYCYQSNIYTAQVDSSSSLQEWIHFYVFNVDLCCVKEFYRVSRQCFTFRQLLYS